LNGLFFIATQVVWHQKEGTVLDFNEARGDGVEIASSRPYAKCLTSLQIKNQLPAALHLIYRLDALSVTLYQNAAVRRKLINLCFVLLLA